MNDKFDIYLKNLCPNPEEVELYLAMMEAAFEAKEGDREREREREREAQQIQEPAN
ncbi:hypothetical protein NEOC95_000472 [Neochlamydia sp. AcF95]|nr:hypothetical protein [Neochlamydia sp. AcF95]